MGFEEITIGKINSPDVFYFVPVHENYDVYKKQVREMNEFFNLKEERSVRICSISFHSIKYSSVCFFYINHTSGMAELEGQPAKIFRPSAIPALDQHELSTYLLM